MFRRAEEAARVGTRMVFAGALVGGIVLLLHGTAYPFDGGDAEDGDRVAQMLLARDPLTSSERAEQAEELLREERRQRLERRMTAVADLLWRGVSSASPSSLGRSARRLWQELRPSTAVSPGQEAALSLLEPDVRAGMADPRALELYERLRTPRQPRGAFLFAWVDGLEGLAEGTLSRAFGWMDRSGAEPAWRAQLTEPPAGAASLSEEERWAAQAIHPWEVRMAASLLSGGYERALDLGPPHPDADLGRATALLLLGRREDSLAVLRDLRGSDGVAGLTAARWLADPDVDPGAVLLREQRSYRLRRALGWIGGEPLQARGLELSGDGLRSWRDTFSALNLAVSMPTRVVRGWEPPRDDLRRAAEHYVQIHPEGPQSEVAARWLDDIEFSEASRRRGEGWDDARLVLPRARTPYPRVIPIPLLVTSELIEQLPAELQSELRGADDEADAVLLTPADARGGRALDSTAALQVLSQLALALEGGSAHSVEKARPTALEAIRRLDAAVRAGEPTLVRPWHARGPDYAEALRRVATGETDSITTRAPEQSERDEGDLVAGHAVVAEAGLCPASAVCLDRTTTLTTVASAHFESDGTVKLGARTSFQEAAVSVQLKGLGPSASVTVPVSSWLGFSRWLPMNARLGIGLGGISLAPSFGPQESGALAAASGE
jgi:hypothetical protein